MEERTMLTALGNMVDSLGSLSLVAIAPDDPLALPEPPGPEHISAYEAQISQVKTQVDTTYHDLLAMSARDYQAGYADRAGLDLLEVLRKLAESPDYNRSFSDDGQRALARFVADLREL